MKRYPERLLVAAVPLLLAACASVGTAPPPAPGAGGMTLPQTPGPAVAADRDSAVPTSPGLSTQTSPVPGSDAGPASDLPAAAEPPPLPPVSGNRAVIALLDRAQQDTVTGRPEAAGATLERALRIEPRNARLWHELAQLRLAQGQYAQSIALAQKSNSFAATQRRLQAMNWRVIAQSRIAQGNAAEGQKALALASELER
ncbi:MAG: tetratricopeptide repeat protein [Hylemonella sp.]|nr:tetratricopeptide repeat protein [Hylemonella sp.]